MKPIVYPNILDRVKAAVIDMIVFVLFIFLINALLSLFSAANNMNIFILFISAVLLYEPILVSSFGGTIGHQLTGLKVKQNNNQNENLLLPVALFRFVLKFLLGWVSLFSIGFNHQKRAIHDFASNSIVLFKRELIPQKQQIRH